MRVAGLLLLALERVALLHLGRARLGFGLGLGFGFQG